MHDREIVAAIVEGDATGLSAAFDQYARGLYAYCRSQLTDPADVTDAVQDTFVIASSKVSGLREPDRLRAWLFAVARNECHGRLPAGLFWAPDDDVAEMTDDVGDVGADDARAEPRAVVRAALARLNAAEREIIELNLRHGLDGADLADALGVPRRQAQALVSRARSRFETSLAILLVNRPGPEPCPELAAIVDGRAGKLTAALRRRIKRHVDRCRVCDREFRPAMQMSLLPMAILPVGPRQRIFRLVTDASPDAAAYRARVAHGAEPFGAGGFPVQLMTPSAPRLQGSFGMTAVAAVAALALLGGGTLYADYTVGSGGTPPSAAVVRTPAPRSTGSGRSARANAATPTASDSAHASTPPTTPPPASPLPAAPPPAATPPAATPPATVPPTTPPAATPPAATPPTATPPTATPPTATPPTATPPTATPPTATPPTATPPTATPPTATPPTATPPTAVPPTAVPPTAVPPTAVPPTAVPPTTVPPTTVLPTSPLPPTAGSGASSLLRPLLDAFP